MKKRTKLLVKRIAAVGMAAMVVLMSFFPVIAFAEGSFSTGNFTTGNFQTGTFSPGNFSTGNFTPGNFTPGNFTPGEFTPGEFNPGEFNPGEFNPGNFTPGEFSPSDFAPGQGSTSGQFTPGQGSAPGQLTPGNPTSPGNFTPGDPGNTSGGNGGDSTLTPTDPFNTDKPGNTESPTDNNSKDNTNGDSSSDETPMFDFKDNPTYEGVKSVMNDLLFPAIQGLDKHTIIDIDWDRYDQEMGKSMAKSLVKNQLGDLFEKDPTGLGELGLDIWSGVDHYKHLSGFFNSWTDIKSIWSAATTTGGSFSGAAGGAGSIFSKITKPFDMGTGIAGKAAPWMAAISTGISGAETIMNFANGDNVDGFASLGETLMSGAVVLSATGVGAPIAAGVAIAGGVLWAGAMAVKHWDTVVNTAKAVGNGVKKAAKAVGDAVKGGIDVVKSGFKKIAGWFG